MSATTHHRSWIASSIVPTLVYWGSIGFSLGAAAAVYLFGIPMLPLVAVSALCSVWILRNSDRRISGRYLKAWHVLRRAGQHLTPFHSMLLLAVLALQIFVVLYYFAG